jgi:hypothetical protein
MPSKNPTIQKAFKDGIISKGQYDKLSDGLLLGIIKKKKGSKSNAKQSNGQSPKPKGKKEERHKMGKQSHKSGRPKKGSKLEVS